MQVIKFSGAGGGNRTLLTIAGSAMIRGHGEFSAVLEIVEFQLLSAACGFISILQFSDSPGSVSPGCGAERLLKFASQPQFAARWQACPG
jgi:hypothetical protein